jgi:hypothetical protein
MRSYDTAFSTPITSCYAHVARPVWWSSGAMRRRAAALALVATAACTSAPDAATGALTADAVVANPHGAPTCRPRCVIAASPNFYATRPDSAASQTVMGYAQVVGDTATTVLLRLRRAAGSLAALGDSVRVTVDGAAMASLTLRDLERGFSFRLPLEKDTSLVAVLLETPRAGARGGGELVLESDAKVIQSSSMVSAQRGPALQSVSLSVASNSSSLWAPQGTFDATTWEISPWATNDAFLGTFQSGYGTGASSAIEISFSQPITSITVTAIDPTWSGNRIIATGPNSAETVNFEQSNQPGLLVRSTRTLVGDFNLVRLVPAPGDYVLYEASFTIGDKAFVVKCEPVTVTRGDNVTCSAEVIPATAFTLVSRFARALDSLAFSNSETPGVSVPVQNGVARHEWRGIAAASSMVTFTASIPGSNGTPKARTDSASFSVSARAWAELSVADPKVIKTELKQGYFYRYPPDSGTTLGLHQLEYIDVFKKAPETRVTSGPNRGLSMLTTPIKNLGSKIWMHPGLYNNSPSKAWYAQQNGIDTVPNPTVAAGFIKRCNATQFNEFAKVLERHEGVGKDPARSHWGLWVTWIATRRLQAKFESLVVTLPFAGAVRNEAYSLAAQELFPVPNQQNPDQALFDTSEYPKIPVEFIASQNCFPFFYP